MKQLAKVAMFGFYHDFTDNVQIEEEVNTGGCRHSARDSPRNINRWASQTVYVCGV